MVQVKELNGVGLSFIGADGRKSYSLFVTLSDGSKVSLRSADLVLFCNEYSRCLGVSKSKLSEYVSEIRDLESKQGVVSVIPDYFKN